MSILCPRFCSLVKCERTGLLLPRNFIDRCLSLVIKLFIRKNSFIGHKMKQFYRFVHFIFVSGPCHVSTVMDMALRKVLDDTFKSVVVP